jgi:hypothetical protein
MKTAAPPPAFFLPGVRVRIEGHWEWPDGTTGVIEPFPGFIRDLSAEAPDSEADFIAAGLVRKVKARHGHIYCQWVQFDEPTDDGSGDGPYRGGEVDNTCLRADLDTE